ncbi:TetR/AcrR family transcriptional regulator [Lutibacter sp. A64]|uniref:TetR/AcrR family transcriptional regulator n=1 Tax=Lutibacter sp. A64 TaxID=2918526 RepID=UPI001F06A605|nr:TetR/AcrR family transcriptional regulator [Lutibacter sp. A64]UMB53002.1 TetR/AcrR family transcriptional regulator [Lutibacter sp. A64]
MAIRQKCDKKRKALLDATLTLVNNNGFHAAPMSKIAKMAAVSPATIYIYFENKQDLINQLYLEIKAAFSAYAFKNYNEEESIKDSFRQVWMNIADFKLNQIPESNFLSQIDNAPIIDEESRLKGLKHLQPLLDLWERGQQKGVIKLVSPYLLYAYTIYPLAFLSNMKQKELLILSENNLEDAFEAAWNSIKA